MSRRIALIPALLSLFATGDAAAEDRPNVVLIVADDLGWADLGCYGSTFYKTPNLDRLAAGGRRATQAYAACPVCSPTRAAIAVGVAGIFAETHQDPASAPSDGPNMIPLEYLETYLSELVDIDRIAKGRKNLHFFSE